MMLSFRSPWILVLLLAGGLVSACGGPGATLDDMPDWMAEKPESEQYLFGTATAVSDGLQTALKKAETRARGDIASTVEVRFQGLTKDFQEEAGDEYLEQFTQAQKEVVSQFLRGTQVRQQKVLEEDGRFRAYVLMEMPIGQASKQLLSKLKQNEALYTRFRASEAFQELQNAVEKYEQDKADETQ
ncbi:MAG: LPP20 family lipoprotein [Salinibacter sp.]